MNRNIRKCIAGIIGAAIALCSFASAFAAGYAPVQGDASFGFRQYLVIDKDAQIPDITFEYSIEPGDAVSPSPGKMAVLKGAGAPSIGKAVFTAEEAAADTAAAGITLEEGQKYAVKTVSLDFTGVSFTEPGIYRYIVKMTSSGQQATSYDIQKGPQAAAKERILDVYVIDRNGTLKIGSYALHDRASAIPTTSEMGSGNAQADHERLADKSEGFVNLYATQDLEFGKVITGNQGAKDKYFAFTLKITGAAPFTRYFADLSDAEARSGATGATSPENRDRENPASFTTDASGNASASYYLCSSQYLRVKGLPRGCGYSLSEDCEDYLKTEGITAQLGKGGKAYSDPSFGIIEAKDVFTGFTNTREGVIPTGVIASLAPSIGILAAGAFGTAGMLLGKKKDEDEEQIH